MEYWLCSYSRSIYGFELQHICKMSFIICFFTYKLRHKDPVHLTIHTYCVAFTISSYGFFLSVINKEDRCWYHSMRIPLKLSNGPWCHSQLAISKKSLSIYYVCLSGSTQRNYSEIFFKDKRTLFAESCYWARRGLSLYVSVM